MLTNTWKKCSAQQQINYSENIASPEGVSRGTRISSLPGEILACETADVFAVVASLPPKHKEATTGVTFAVRRQPPNVFRGARITLVCEQQTYSRSSLLSLRKFVKTQPVSHLVRV